ncbi:MFS transporter [Brucellaceae bacterium C25G]
MAAALLFLMNGYIFGSWAPRIPEFAARMGFDSAHMGLMILVFGIGSVLFMPVAGALCARFGSATIVKTSALAVVPVLLLISLVNHEVLAVIVLFYFGGFIAAMDVAMNANAVAMEKSLRRALMSSCHAFWSLGGLLGAGSAGYLLTSLGSLAHGIIVSVIAGLFLIFAWPHILEDKIYQAEERPKLTLPRQPLPWLIGLLALFSMIPEGAIMDWGSYYLRQGYGASVETASFTFAAFSLTMAVMRFAGDSVRDRFGAVRTLRVCTLIASFGLLMAAFAPTPWLAIAGFAVCGIGISNMAPIIFSMAGNVPGVVPSVSLSITTSLGYSGTLVAPSFIGWIAKFHGFGIVFACLPLLLLVVLIFSGLARFADHNPDRY